MFRNAVALIETSPTGKRISGFVLRKPFLRSAGLAIAGSLLLALYGVRYGLSYRELVVVFGASILGLIVFGGERGIKYGFVLWVLTLGLGYRTIAWTKALHIHPSEILLWGLLACICVHRKLVANAKLTFPWWMWLLMPFWVFAWWPLILGDAPWDKMLNEFRDFMLLIPLMIVTTVVLRDRSNWQRLLMALFVTGTWIGVMGILEFWFSSIPHLLPAFMSISSAGVIDGFERAMFSFWGGPMATFVCALSLPVALAALRWWQSRWQRVLIVIASLAQLVAIYIGGYRSIWLFVLIQILLACMLSLKRQRLAIAAVCVVVAVGGYQFVPQAGSDRAISGIEALRGRATDSSAKARINRASWAFDKMVAAPLGNGWSSAGWVHSDFIQVGANLGLLGGLIFLGGYLYTLLRLARRAFLDPRHDGEGEVGVALLLSYICAGGILATQGVEVLPQLILPVWFIWVLAEVWLRQCAESAELKQTDRTSHLSYLRESYGWWPLPLSRRYGLKQ